MQIRYYKEYSRFLNRFMEFKVYGHSGRPIVIFPCQSGRFFDWRIAICATPPRRGSTTVSCRSSRWTASTLKAGITTAQSARVSKQERWCNYIARNLSPDCWRQP